MIRLTKGPRPNVLTANASRWTQELLATLAAGNDPTPTQLSHYRHLEIKDALKEETHRKCAYCESKPLHVTHGDVEHIVPKSIHPELAYEWENLTLACDSCNTQKSNREGFVDPYSDDPQLEFGFQGPMIFSRPGQNRAERTVARLRLNRIDLFERRGEKLETLLKQLYRLKETVDVQQREFLRNTLIDDETSDDKEYAACVRAFIVAMQAEGYI
jgi:uncharacterized protein (TIGR02646 family)